MRRAERRAVRVWVALVGLALVTGLSPPLAVAAPPGPTVLTFDSQPAGTGLGALLPGSGLTFSVTPVSGSGSCSGQLINDQTTGHRALQLTCPPGSDPKLRIAFPALEYWVGLQLAPDSIPADLFDYLPSGDALDDSRQTSPGPGSGQSGSPWSPPVSIASRVGGADIASVTVQTESATSSTMTVRSVAFSPLPQPVTEFTASPPALSASAGATFAFDESLPGASWQCSLDGKTAQACTSPFTLANVPDGSHYLTVFLVSDDYAVYPIPPNASVFWTVDTTPPQTSVSVEPGGDFYPPGSEQITLDSDDSRATFQCSLDGAPFGPCPDDGVYESLAAGPHRLLARAIDAAGNVDRTPAEADFTVVESPFAPPGVLVAGRSSNLETLLGQILVFLQGKGFEPLTQAASVPIGTPIDARKGKLRVDTAASFSKPGAAQSAQISAGIFVIRQRRARKGAADTDLALQTPAGQSRACAARVRPAKGVVRTLTVNVTKGVYRTVAAVARVTAGRARISVQDTCAGTRVHVASGHAAVFNTRTKRTTTVRAGRTLMIKARLFAARVHG